jgi:hypothetical protein
MAINPYDTPRGKLRSRVETTRRQFLLLVGTVGALGATLFGGIELLKFMFPAATLESPPQFKTGFTVDDLTGETEHGDARPSMGESGEHCAHAEGLVIRMRADGKHCAPSREPSEEALHHRALALFRDRRWSWVATSTHPPFSCGFVSGARSCGHGSGVAGDHRGHRPHGRVRAPVPDRREGGVDVHLEGRRERADGEFACHIHLTTCAR